MTAALSPDHIADLRNSGLDDVVIEILGFRAVRPADIPIKAALSAYRIPYFNLDGTRNCFHRLKLVPPMKENGRTMKYWQPPGSHPHLYCPPLLNWQTIVRNSHTILTITEGEKKAAAACQRGLVTAGVGGVWCWASTLDNGEKLVLPMLDAFMWADRTVWLCPDSDAWHEGKEQNILGGFFALAKDLEHRGATVQFVRLPDVHGVKAGLDDWLLIPGNDVDDSWPKLERIPLDDARFDSLTSWWQRWREKQATQHAIQQHEGEHLDVTETAGLYVVRSSTYAVRIEFDRLTEQRGGISAEVTVSLGATELLAGVDLGLKSDSGQTKLAGSLKAIAPSIPWKLLLQRACSLVLRRHRKGEPPLHLTQETIVAPLSYSVNPLVFRHKTTILYGDGGLGKSTLGLLCGLCVSTGRMVAGLVAITGRALYLDYEDDSDVHTRRLQAIVRGHPELAGASVLYQRCTEPLAKITYPLVRKIQEQGVTFLIVDSLIAATGGEASAEATAKLFASLRTLKVEVLAIGHVPKTQGEGQDHASVYGSVFNQNFARSVWEIKREQAIGEDGAILGLFNRKSNLSRLHLPIGLKVTQDQEGALIRYEPFNLSQTIEIEKALPLANRIRNLLDSDGVPRSSKQVADELNVKQTVTQATLSRYKGRKWSMIGENKEALWTTLKHP
jgi:hypothetical protein